MFDLPYLEQFDDSALAEAIGEARENDLDARSYAELFYLPLMVSQRPGTFLSLLNDQGEKLIHDIYRRSYGLFGELCPFGPEEFGVTQYTFGEVPLALLDLPETVIGSGNSKQIIVIIDADRQEVQFMTVCQYEDGNLLFRLHYDTSEWTEEGEAPADPKELLGKALSLVYSSGPAYRYVAARCPLCGTTYKLGLTADELEGYRRFREDDEDLEDAIPALNLFEREFLLSGMCPDCQCRVFGKELPADLSRWALGE
ncbi:MAG: hypothetical protein E7436_05220 [Ruminococcaceae bacterium]|nr:hypothetical protein [Oscillospiraceae bacterium]